MSTEIATGFSNDARGEQRFREAIVRENGWCTSIRGYLEVFSDNVENIAQRNGGNSWNFISDKQTYIHVDRALRGRAICFEKFKPTTIDLATLVSPNDGTRSRTFLWNFVARYRVGIFRTIGTYLLKICEEVHRERKELRLKNSTRFEIGKVTVPSDKFTGLFEQLIETVQNCYRGDSYSEE